MSKTPVATRFGWGVVLGAALIMSAWSLYYVARYAGAPVFAAGITSLIFDGAALLAGYYALKAARAGESGTAARAAMFLFAGCSAYLNSMHAGIDHLPVFARVLYGMPPVIAVIVYELHTSSERNRALSRTKRKLPSLGLLTWLLMPLRSYRTIRSIVSLRAIRTLRIAESGPNTREKETVSQSFSEFPDSSSEFLPVSISDARVWARANGYLVADRGPVPAFVIDAYRIYLENLTGQEGSA